MENLEANIFNLDEIGSNSVWGILDPFSQGQEFCVLHSLNTDNLGVEDDKKNKFCAPTRRLIEVRGVLRDFLAQSEAITLLEANFGEYWDIPTAVNLIASLANGQDFPSVEILPQEVLSAQGAFSQQNNTIYLSQQLLETGNSQAIVSVLLEELGHYLDSKLNPNDTPGDEGRLFATVVQGIELTPLERESLAMEDDRLFITLNGETFIVEQSLNDIIGTAGRDILTGTSGGDRIIGGAGADIITGGGGNDLFVYQSIRDAGDTIKDFEIGKDQIDLTLVLQSFGYTGFNPLADSYIKLNPYSAGTVVLLDSDGKGSLTARPYIYLETIQPTGLTALDFLPNPGTPPEITANLVNDTGASAGDRLTFDPTITGQIIYSSPLVSLKAQLNGQPVEILPQLLADNTFTLTTSQLEQINGGSLPDGEYILKLTAQDTKGNISLVYNYNFILDRTAPALSLDLDPDFDSAPLGDLKTTLETVTLVGVTEANLSVSLIRFSSLGIGNTTANNLGEFSFSNQSLLLGDNVFVVSATDLAGNQGQFSQTIERLIDVEPPTITADIVNDTGTSDSDRLTLDPTINGQTEGATSLQGNLNGNGFVDISNALNDDGSFTVSFEQYDLLSNGSFSAGDYTLALKAKNSSGQESQVVTVSFTLDWIAPLLSFGLAPESDTGVKGDNVTTEYHVNLIGQTEPGLEVVLVETQQMVVADETGAFTFFDVAMPSAGQAPYSLVVSDAAGNQGRAQEFLTREGINGAPEITSTPEANFDPATQVTYAYQVEAIDPDGDELSYRLINAPSGAKIDENGLLIFTPSGNTTPSYDFKVEVGDDRGGVETQTFTVEVLGVGEGLGTIRGMKWEDLDGNGKPYTDTASTFPGLNNSVAVELDTYNNGAIDDNSNNHIGILTNGNLDAIAQTTVSPSFKNGGLWNVWIDYNGGSKTLEARVSQDVNRPVDPTVSAVVNIPAILNQEQIFVGLAATTGAAVGQHEIFDWDFEVNGSEINESLDILPNRTIEPGLAGVTVYLDLNDNEVLDNGEPFQVTAEDDPNTPDIDETGQYEFNFLEPGTYVVREIVPDGYVQTAPIGTVVGSAFDGEFEQEDWFVSYFASIGNPNLEQDSDEYQRLDDGNPDAHREMIHTWDSGQGIIYHRYGDYTYDPAIQGEFDKVNYIEDQRAFVSGIVGRGMVVFQDGDIFRTTPNLVFSGFGNSTWQTWVLSNIKESDFISDITGNNPDFSENGSPIQFGYWRSNSNIGGQTIRHGIDNWSVTLIDTSTNSYRVNLSAGEIVENIDFGNALAGSINVAPRIVSNPITTGYIGVPYQYNVAAIDGNGDALTYTLVKAPQGMEISDTGVITWTTGAIGSYEVEVQVDDGKGGIVTQPYELNVAEVPVDEEAPEVAFGFSGTVLSVGETVSFQISGQDNFGLADLDISFNGESLTLNPANIERGEIYTASFTPDRPGIFEVLATATDFGGNTDTETLSVRVLDPNDTSAPIAQLDISDFDPLNLVIREKTEIKGTINDENLEFYRVELAPVSLVDLSNPAAKDPDYITIAEGTGNIEGILASIDPALYRNDNYFVRIYAQDINGNVTVEGFGVGIDSQTKPGEFSLEFTDLSIPLTGIPIEVTRRYSSLDANFQGDFGYGWELGLQDAQIVESAPTGVDLTFDDFFGGNSFTEGTRVTLTTPDGRRVGFTFTPEVFSPSAGIFLGPDYYAWRPKFTPDPGVYETLEVPYVPIMRLSDGSFGIYLFGLTYNPRDYILTTKDGTKYSYSQVNGLQKVEDRNSNTLIFTDNGITSSTGAKIDFIRDAQGRITEIIDPDGKSLKYSYDANGNLIEFGDRTDNETTFEYEAEREHYLTEIIDPLNRTSVRTEYDENGQISKIFDADGNALDIDYDSATSRQTVKDPFGNTTTYVFDPRGNVVSQIDALAGVTARTYDANNNLLSETDPEGNTKSYTYDSRGNKLSETDGEGKTKTYTYNARNDILTETDALGNITNYTYDANGNLTRRQDALGNVTTYTYGQNGLLTEVIDANGKQSNFSYDGYGNITALVDPTGANTTFTYDRNGRVASLTDALGAITNYVYDAQGRLIEKADPEGSSCGCARGITKTEYNTAGEKIAEIDALGRRTEYRYSDRGLLIETILPDETPTDLTDQKIILTGSVKKNKPSINTKIPLLMDC